MAEEIFDVVNDRDEVVDRRPRSEVHRLGLKHRATHILVYNSRGEWFLQQRSLRKDCSPGLWDSSSSGHLDSGETYDACAVREVGEELGVFPKTSPERLFKVEASPATGQEFCWVYRLAHEGPFELQASEVRGGAWFSPTAIAGWIERRPTDFSGAFLRIWQEAVARGLVPAAGEPIG
ncbi:MAG TPA: NUDIX domain-containing protein [Candidatus Limnocylindria bacterium]|jgi:isopentenyldiphosphate isomerase|nr:NUDIX domain-containing protein [Candidatus Limnocylindria bacterium]